MPKTLPRLLATVLLTIAGRRAAADTGLLEFYEEERQVVSASRSPRPRALAPATVYVVTGEEIRDSGAQTLWEALRVVPGLEVMTTRALHGEVGVRGLNSTLSNRVLVLLDGKTMLNSYFDFVTWEEVPVPLEEIDRVEVVEGPASALYGANAVTGVINIITKTPDQLRGGEIRYRAGERRTHLGSALYGGRTGRTAYKASLSWRSAYGFEDADHPAAKTAKAHALLSRDLADGGNLSVSAGGAGTDTQIAAGGTGIAVADGPVSFLRADWTRRGARLRTFWNHGRQQARDFSAFRSPDLDYDTYDVQAEQALSLPGRNSLVAGASYRRNTMESKIFQPGLHSQDLWALFLENEWKPSDTWAFVASARLDRHPFTDLVFSPRGSVILSPTAGQTVRLSAGSAFRNPTLLENYLFLPVGPSVLFVGNQGLDPERIVFYELAHQARWSSFKTTAACFRYKLRNVIVTAPRLVGPVLWSDFVNRGETHAWGGELGVESQPLKGLAAFTNASYQDLKDDPDSQSRDEDAPKWKLNGGLRARAGRAAAAVTASWVDETRVDEYFLLNLRLAYAFAAAWEVDLSGYNLADRHHRELSAAQSAERLGSRWTVGASHRF